jgi:PPOX class probable F420-dependent enzyme
MGPRTLENLPRWAAELLRDSTVARLGLTDDDGAPRVLPVTFALHEHSIWSAVDRKPKRDPGREPARIRWLRARPRAALTVDRYEDDWDSLAWVQVLGRVDIVEASAAAGALVALAHKYPQYRDQPPPGPVLRLVPERALWWSAAG